MKFSNKRNSHLGRVVSVRGSVIDAVSLDRLPDMNHELRAGLDEEVIVDAALKIGGQAVDIRTKQIPAKIELRRPTGTESPSR